jgi:cytolysin-activating lysine-acyltransferase
MISPNNATATTAQLDSARKELAKLPLLGPVMWLYARDPMRRFTFVSDMDWRLLPPLVLEQCKLYNKQDVPWAFFSWATVSAEVDRRLQSSNPVIAPHEWHSGDVPWLIDAVMPFGEDAALLKEVAAAISGGKPVKVWLPAANGQPALRTISA